MDVIDAGQTSFAVTSKGDLPPSLDGTLIVGRGRLDQGQRFDVIEWPYSHRMLISSPVGPGSAWLPVESRGPTAFAIGHIVIHETLAACEAARP